MRRIKIVEVRTSGDHKDCHIFLEDGSILDGVTFVSTSNSLEEIPSVKLEAFVYPPKKAGQ